jgi:hypothetical protein
MRLDWRAGNVCLVVLSLAGGYAGMSPDRLARSNIDGIACLAILLGMAVVAVGGPFYALRAYGPGVIRRPSWRRGPFRLWRDPLQFLALATVAELAASIGGLSRLPAVGQVGLWTVGSELSTFLGLLVGQVIVYRVLRRRITAE